MNGLHEGGQIARLNVERAGGDQSVEAAQVDANRAQIGQLRG